MPLTVTLPTLHRRQAEIYRGPGRFKAINCGRRFGKTDLLKTIACNRVLKGGNVFWGAPQHFYLMEAFREVVAILGPTVSDASKNDKVIRTITGGRIDFWSLENENAGKSRFYDDAIVDEGAICKDITSDTWQQAIRPTLIDRAGRGWVASSPKGDNPDNFFWKVCKDPSFGFTCYHAPSQDNPYLPASELEEMRRTLPPLVYAQEIEALFVDWSGEAFFAQDSFLVDGAPILTPIAVDYVFCTIDTTHKGGKGRDGTAVSYWAVNSLKMDGQAPLMLLDWDLVEHEGSLLEVWVPQVFALLEDLARLTRARLGSAGCFVEDTAAGAILLQQAPRRGWPMQAIDSKLTATGKDARAINASGYIYQGQVKVTRHAFEKQTVFRGVSRNHFMAQVLAYRPGEDGRDRSDDLADTMFDGVALALGNSKGF